ncbi:toll/interleukin-1 receptor domain-containing protein [Bdellovibrio sp. HCB288]|uniref:toll/interleukin-1 receptor domain-containing protein n=1 Tax=Bdellovibrio sp. HCB288 TaxID=3394355 RepID=UPI0039B53EBF
MAKKSIKPTKATKEIRFESANLESLYPVLDAISWLGMPDTKQIAQFAGVDPRTAGKLLKNCILVGIVESTANGNYSLKLAYPFKGSNEQKTAAIKEALLRMPLVINIRQFVSLGDNLESALRKAATVIGIDDFEPSNFAALLKWANHLKVLEPHFSVEEMVDEAVAQKENRHRNKTQKIVAFLSHSSKDKPFIRQLAADLESEGVSVWLDEQRILVGDSISEKIGQGLAESDYFLIALSDASMSSEWVKKELSAALLSEIEKRQVGVLPIKLSECEIPNLIKDKKYADFSKSYKQGLKDLLAAMKTKESDDVR